MRDWRRECVELVLLVANYMDATQNGDRRLGMICRIELGAGADRVIEAVMSEMEPAQAHDLPQRPLAAFGIGQPRPDLHAANDEQDRTPTEPDPLIA